MVVPLDRMFIDKHSLPSIGYFPNILSFNELDTEGVFRGWGLTQPGMPSGLNTGLYNLHFLQVIEDVLYPIMPQVV